MKNIFKHVKRLFASFLLSGTMLTAGAVYGQDKQETSTALVPDTDGIELLQQEARKTYAFKLFGDSVNTSNPVDSFYYPKRYGEDFPGVFTTATQPENEVDPRVKDLWNNLQVMKNSGAVMGPDLVDFSVRGKVLYGLDSVPWAYGYWKNEDGIIRITNYYDLPADFKLIVQAHETIHGIQKSTGLINDDLSMPIREYQISNLCYEAGGMIGGFLAAYDLYQKGYPGPWNELKKVMPSKARDLQVAWTLACQDSTSYKDALEKTGRIGFYKQFGDAQWLNAYNTGVLMRYLKGLAEGTLPAPSGGTYKLESARLSGYISPAFNFTAALDSLPSSSGLFGGNPRMQNAFDYLELQRLGQTRGMDDPAYTLLRQALVKKGNRYVDISAKDVYESFMHHNGMLGPLELLDILADGHDPKEIKIFIAKPSP